MNELMTQAQPDPPRLPDVPEGSAHCGACVGIEAATPQAIVNRHGLTQLAYRVGDWSQFRASLHAGLSDATLAPLNALLTRDDDDFAIALIDAFACSADVLSFYNERLANESYLATAGERVSLQEMGKLIGYQLRPGVAAEALLAFAVETPPAPPAAMAPEPGVFVSGVPDRVRIEPGFKVQSVPGQDEKPQVFETVEAMEARPQWNAMRALPDARVVPGFGARGTWIAGTATQLKPGDMLLLVGPQFEGDAMSNRWDARVLTEVELDPPGERTRVAWAEPLGSVTPHMAPADPPAIYALRDRAAVFGHNAPDWAGMNIEFKRAYLQLDSADEIPEADRAEWPDFTIWAPLGLRRIADRRAGVAPTTISLDREYSGIVAGSYLLLDRPDYRELYRVQSAVPGSRAEFAVQGKSSYVKLAGANLDSFADKVRQTTVHARSERLAPARTPITAAVTGDTLDVAADVRGITAGRRVLVTGERVDNGAWIAHGARVVAATPAASLADGGALRIDPPLPAALTRSSVVVFGNVALASHGETVAQVLGSGDAAQAHQRFELKHAPLTYRAAANERGVKSELTVRVGDVQWQQRDTLYGAQPTDRVFALNTDEQGRVWLQFGDGRRGARLPGAANNLRARYRRGLGAEGNVRADALSQAMARPLGFKGVSNPAPASGGTPPEDEGSARRSMPLGTRTLGRAVSVLDYEDFARAYAGVAKAQARVLRLRAGPVIAITIAGANNAVLADDNPVWINLQAALKASGDPHVAVRLLAHRSRPFRIGLKLRCDPAYDATQVLAAADAALRVRYAFDQRALGQPVHGSEVVSTVHAVPGVVAVDLDLLHLADALPGLRTSLNAAATCISAGVPAAAELLTLAPGPLARLELMP